MHEVKSRAVTENNKKRRHNLNTLGQAASCRPATVDFLLDTIPERVGSTMMTITRQNDYNDTSRD